MFTNDQKTALAAPLSTKNVKSRKQGGRDVSYVESWKAIEEANRIFGFDGWTSETVELKCVSERERTIGKDQYQKPGFGVSYTARVRIRVGDIVRDGVGAGHGIDADMGQAHESAIKEAESDARKRALMTFGYPFGLALYDKQQEHVADADAVPTKPTPTPLPKLLGEPEATKVQKKFIEDVNGCVTPAELDAYIKSDDAKKRYGSLPEKHRGFISQAIRDRADKIKDRAA